MQKVFKLKSLVAAGGVAVFALLAAPVMTAGHVSLISAAQAAESHTDSDHGSDHGSKGGKGAMKGGSHESGGHGGASKSAEALTTETEDEGKKGPKAGTSSGKKGKPAWAGDVAVTGYDSTVELGRLNVAKAPASVLLRAHDEEFHVLVDATVTNLYDAKTWAEVLLALKSSTARVDSPVANIAFYQDVLKDSKVTMGTETYTTPLTKLEQAAIFLGSAASKEATYGTGIVAGTVKNMNIILGITMSDADVASVAAMAEDVREAIEDAHEGTDTP